MEYVNTVRFEVMKAPSVRYPKELFEELIMEAKLEQIKYPKDFRFYSLQNIIDKLTKQMRRWY